MKQYPKFKYHAAHGPKVVHSFDQEAKLGDDWHDSPAHFGVETCPGRKPDESIAARRIAPAPKAEPRSEQKPERVAAPKKAAAK